MSSSTAKHKLNSELAHCRSEWAALLSFPRKSINLNVKFASGTTSREKKGANKKHEKNFVSISHSISSFGVCARCVFFVGGKTNGFEWNWKKKKCMKAKKIVFTYLLHSFIFHKQTYNFFFMKLFLFSFSSPHLIAAAALLFWILPASPIEQRTISNLINCYINNNFAQNEHPHHECCPALGMKKYVKCYLCSSLQQWWWSTDNHQAFMVMCSA